MATESNDLVANRDLDSGVSKRSSDLVAPRVLNGKGKVNPLSVIVSLPSLWYCNTLTMDKVSPNLAPDTKETLRSVDTPVACISSAAMANEPPTSTMVLRRPPWHPPSLFKC